MEEVELVLDVKDELGEGPLWHAGEGVLYWVDIEKGIYHTYQPDIKKHQTVEVGVRIGALGFRRQGGLVLATEQGFAFFDPTTRAYDLIGNPEHNKPQARFNDGAVDRAGRFWAGTLGDDDRNSLYCLDPGGAIRRMDTGFRVSNGIGWSPDNTVMYFVDSEPGTIFAYDFDLHSGHLKNRRVWVDRSQEQGVPDGLTVDAEGFVWIAVWGGSCLERYDPDGRREKVIRVPVEFPTSMAFGGPNLDELYITSAKFEIPLTQRPNAPLAGNLFRILGAGHGIQEPLFDG